MKTTSFLQSFHAVKVLLLTLLFSLSLGFGIAHAAPPANDNFAKAQTISGVSGTASGDLAAATVEPGEPNTPGEDRTVWYKWKAPYRGSLIFSTVNSETDGQLSLYKGTTLTGLTSVGDRTTISNTDDEQVSLYVQASDILYIRVSDNFYPKAQGITKYQLSWSLQISPTNDDFIKAYALAGSSGSIGGSNVAATIEAGEPQISDRSTVWYKWTAPATGKATFDLVGSPLDTSIIVYSGTRLTALTAIGESDDSPNSDDGLLTFPVTANTVYYFQIWGRNGAQGDFVLHWASDGPVTHSISGQVYTADVASVKVPVLGAIVKNGTQSFTTGSDGYYNFSGLTGTSYTMTATVPISGYIANPQGFTNPVHLGNNATSINFKAAKGTTPTPTPTPQGNTVSGQVVTYVPDAHNVGVAQGLPDVLIVAVGSDETTPTMRTLPDGTFSLPNLSAPSYSVVPSKAGALFDPFALNVVKGTSGLLFRTYSMGGLVYRLEGKTKVPLSGIQINLKGVIIATTGSDGKWFAYGFASGVYSINAVNANGVTFPAARTVTPGKGRPYAVIDIQGTTGSADSPSGSDS